MRDRGSTSKWIAIGLVAVLAAIAWTSLREPTAPPQPAPQAQSGTTQPPPGALELPPPMPAVADADADAAPVYPDFLPPEAVETLQRIARGGPYPYRQDDGVFQNRERRLPQRPRGYYREYTVDTPGSPDRGARRIVTGGRPPVEYYYTDDHYRSFTRFTLDGSDASR